MRSTKILEKQFYGDEPIYKGTVTESQIARALNWHNYMSDEERGLSWLLEYLRKSGYSPEVISGIRSAPKNRIRSTDLWLARMALMGATLPQETLDRFSQRILEASTHSDGL